MMSNAAAPLSLVKIATVRTDRSPRSMAAEGESGPASIRRVEKFIVVGIDGSDAAIGAARWAAAEAQRRGVALELLHAYQIPMISLAEPTAQHDLDAAARAKAMTALNNARSAVKSAYPGMTVTTVMRRAAPVHVLREASENAVLTVVGSNGHLQLTEAFLGSVAVRVAEHARGPVVVIRADHDLDRSADNPVMVGLDGSPDSDGALAFAFEEASLRRVALFAVRAWDDTAPAGFPEVYPPLIDSAAIDGDEAESLNQQLAPWEEKYPEVPVRPLIFRGRPAQVLLRCCGDADRSGRRAALMVVGSHGHGGFAGMLMGSTSRAVIAHAPCGVAVVRS